MRYSYIYFVSSCGCCCFFSFFSLISKIRTTYGWSQRKYAHSNTVWMPRLHVTRETWLMWRRIKYALSEIEENDLLSLVFTDFIMWKLFVCVFCFFSFLFFFGIFSFVDINDDVCKVFRGARIVVRWTMISWWRYYNIRKLHIFINDEKEGKCGERKQRTKNAPHKNRTLNRVEAT